MQNAFGYEIPPIKEIVTDSSVKETVAVMLTDVLTYLGLPQAKSQNIVDQCLEAASNHQTLETYEEQAHNIIDAEKITQRIPEKLAIRAGLKYSYIAPYLLDGNLLDYGCGDGHVSQLIAEKKGIEATLTDVYEHRSVKATGLCFKLFKQGEKAPFDDAEFSNVIVLTVFHHCSNPTQSIQEVARITKPGGRVIVVESVFGVDGKQLPPEMQRKIAGYIHLSAEQQRLLNVFFDHFYNRILFYNPDPQMKVNVPFNFNTPDNWKQVFAQNGLKQEKLVHLGLDQQIAPEYHTLHILRKVQ
jgi:ubiquinone/menaquinone biosynthesis C-methylase UbiE